MDRIKPIDLQKANIPRVMRGLDPSMVNMLLQSSATEIEQLLNEQLQLKGDNERLRAELTRFREMENSLRDAIMIAQRAADETRSNAHKEADLIIESAKQKASEQQHEYATEMQSLIHEIEALKKEKERFERQFRILLQDHLKELDQTHSEVRAVVQTEASEVLA